MSVNCTISPQNDTILNPTKDQINQQGDRRVLSSSSFVIDSYPLISLQPMEDHWWVSSSPSSFIDSHSLISFQHVEDQINQHGDRRFPSSKFPEFRHQFLPSHLPSTYRRPNQPTWRSAISEFRVPRRSCHAVNGYMNVSIKLTEGPTCPTF